MSAATASTRLTVPDLVSPHPLGDALPGLYREQELVAPTGEVRPGFGVRFSEAFDELLAPVFSTLDNQDAYFDPRLTPPDFLDWLGEWVGVELDENWTLTRRRALILRASELYRWRGTARGLAAAVAILTGVEPEIVDTGGVAWSQQPQSTLPGTPDAHVTVHLRVEHPESLDRMRLDAVVAAAKPAHVTASVEVAST
jgi:phage tail-like protein